jgi:hypothetical protein
MEDAEKPELLNFATAKKKKGKGKSKTKKPAAADLSNVIDINNTPGHTNFEYSFLLDRIEQAMNERK